MTTSVVTGTYIDPVRGRVTVGEWAQHRLDGRVDLKSSTRERYEGIERMYLTHDQVHRIAAAIRTTEAAWGHPVEGRDGYALAVLFLAHTGVRFGELAALRVGRVDLLRRRALIAESVPEVNGIQV